MNANNPAQLVQQIAQIQRMEHGKLSVMGAGPDGRHYKHQVWENGKNVSRYIPGDQAAAVQEAIEGYHRTVIGSRCKQSRMFWGKPGAENVLALRCIQASRRLDQFWKHRLNAHAGRNDRLSLAE